MGASPTHIALTRQLSAVRVGEDGLAADGGDADAVPVVADPRDGALEVPVRLAEAEPVEQRDRPRAHGDDVAEDPADAGRRALEGLDGGRMVVALDLERDGLAVAEVDHAGVLARPLEHARRRTRAAAGAAGPNACTPQCSDQRREKTASSKWFGSRPSSPRIRSSSPSVSPSARWSGCSTTCVR